MKLSPLFALLFLCVSTIGAFAAEDLTVLPPSADGTPPHRQLEQWLKREFYRLVEQRSAAFETMLKSEQACRQWQQERREFFLRQIGGLPQRTPLNAQIVGRLPGKGYSVEKIIFESRPRFHVTANLYLPDSPPPYPAVLVPCGHSHEGKAVGQYQRICILLARHGMAAMCYDPIGQGERYQMLDTTQQRASFIDAAHVATPHPNVRFMCTTEHTMVGLSSALLGANVAQFRIWDGMRVIDYLQSRPDILADKIGCTGNSGGGTETAYLMALDDRIVAAAPGCYLTTFRRLLDSKGPQDGEQNIAGQIAFGMDEADYCIMRAPRPTLIGAGVRDATFDFRGTWELFQDAKRFYSRLGHPEKMDLAAPDAPHGFTLQLREATVQFMHRWLIGGDKQIREVEQLPDTITDEQLRAYNEPDWTADQLRCTPAGQVLLMPHQRSVFDINTDTAQELRKQRATAWNKLDSAQRREQVERAIGARPWSELPPGSVEFVGQVERDGYVIRKAIAEVDAGLRLPALVFQPAQPSGVVTLYLHGASMTADAAPGGAIEQLVKRGQTVIAAELRGIGETDTGRDKIEFGRGRFGRDNLEILTAYLMGKSYVGMRVDDIRLWTRAVQSGSLGGVKPRELHLLAIGETGVAALHAAALRPDDFQTVVVRGAIPAWETIVTATETFDQAVNVVHGVLRSHDLSDLLPLIGAERVSVSEPVDAMGRVIREQ